MKVQKRIRRMILLGIVISFSITMFAQEESPFSVGGDLVSSYVWRGSKIGTGPNIQPYVEFTTGNLTIGSWGSFSLHEGGNVMEVDLYASYGFDFGLSLGLQIIIIKDIHYLDMLPTRRVMLTKLISDMKLAV